MIFSNSLIGSFGASGIPHTRASLYNTSTPSRELPSHWFNNHLISFSCLAYGLPDLGLIKRRNACFSGGDFTLLVHLTRVVENPALAFSPRVARQPHNMLIKRLSMVLMVDGSRVWRQVHAWSLLIGKTPESNHGVVGTRNGSSASRFPN